MRIYVQDKPLFLLSETDNRVEKYRQQSGTVYMNELTGVSIDNLLEEMEKREVSAGVFSHANPDELLTAFKSHLTLIQAAGGLVYTLQKQVLLIFRRGKWDLPKGKLEEGESLETCAVREIEEETGLAEAKILEPLSITYYTYHEKGKHILKESHWFLMTGSSEKLKPQGEEDIEKCEWVPIEDVLIRRSQMHASIADVIEEGMKRLR